MRIVIHNSKPTIAVVAVIIFLTGFASGACIYQWTPTGWIPIGDGALSFCSGYVQAISQSYDDHALVVGGIIRNYAAAEQFEHLGTLFPFIGNWQPFPQLEPDFVLFATPAVNVILHNGPALYVAGWFTLQQGECQNIALWPNLLNYTDQPWTALGQGVNDVVTAMILADNMLFVGGHFTQVDGHIPSAGYALWRLDENAWDENITCTNCPVHPTAFGLQNMTQFGQDVRVWSADYFTGVSRLWYCESPCSEWRLLPATPGPSSTIITGIVNTFEFLDQWMFIGGRFGSVNGITCNNVARYDISQQLWLNMGTGITASVGTATVFSFAVNGSDVFVAGQFDAAGQAQAYSVARYNSVLEQWEDMGLGFFGTVHSLAVTRSSLYAGLWEYSPPATSMVVTFAMYGLVSFVLLLLLILTMYFVKTYFCVPENPKHEAFARWFSTMIILIAVLVTSGTTAHVAAVNQIAESVPDLSLSFASFAATAGRDVQFAVATFSAPFVGYFSNRVPTRYLLMFGLVCSGVGSLVFFMMISPFMVFLSFAIQGLAYGVVLVTGLAYYARTTSTSLIGPMMSLYFADFLAGSILPGVTGVLFETDFHKNYTMYGGMQLVLTSLAAVIMWFGFREQSIHDSVILPLRRQFQFPRAPVVILTIFYFFVQMFNAIFANTVLMYIHRPIQEVIFYAGAFGVSCLVLVVFLILAYYKHRGPRSLAVTGFAVLCIGYVLVITSMFTMPGDTVLFTAETSRQEIPFLLGSVVVLGVNNVVFALIAALVVRGITQTSKGTVVGIFMFVGLAAPFLASNSAITHLFAATTAQSQGILFSVLGGIVLLVVLLFLKLYRNFTAVMLLPFVPASLRFTITTRAQAGETSPSMAVPVPSSAPVIFDMRGLVNDKRYEPRKPLLEHMTGHNYNTMD